MNTIDFLSSDIEFPCDSNEPKLSASPCTKLPESVDWSFHDYYSTILEKNFTPIQTITDIQPLEPVPDQVSPPHYLQDWKNPSLFSVHDKQDDQAVFFVLANAIKPSSPMKENNLRAALRGALDMVEKDMQKNMQDTFKIPTPTSMHPRSTFNKDHYLTWKDDILTENLHIGTLLDQDLWDDDDEDDILRGDASPAYHAIDENPIIDSSLPSRISSIMPLSSTPSVQSRSIITQNSNYSFGQHAAQIATISEDSATSSPPEQTAPIQSPLTVSVEEEEVATVSSASVATKSNKIKSVWSKIKQATTKQLKNKKAFKRLFH
ncbi:hypothetical protein BC941DRAFT_408136 [Chlamydoabsidia padenii]|nr:hypothetical protein BC941DRAFT_408136 [Chlamydoabsidia padenii]